MTTIAKSPYIISAKARYSSTYNTLSKLYHLYEINILLYQYYRFIYKLYLRSYTKRYLSNSLQNQFHTACCDLHTASRIRTHFYPGLELHPKVE